MTRISVTTTGVTRTNVTTVGMTTTSVGTVGVMCRARLAWFDITWGEFDDHSEQAVAAAAGSAVDHCA